MSPNALLYNPDAIYLRELMKLTDLSQEKAAAALGISPRQLRYYLSTASDHQDAPYCVQFALECLAGAGGNTEAQAARTIGLIVKAAGGQVRVRHKLIADLDHLDQLDRYDDPATGDVVYSVHRQQERRRA